MPEQLPCFKPLADLAVENSFANLPAYFYTPLAPSALSAPYLVSASAAAAATIQLEPAELLTENFVQIFSGNCLLPGSRPVAAVYSGHQFGVWAGQLGDGRALLLGEVTAASGFSSTSDFFNLPNFPHAATISNEQIELQLKGSGRTPYSRGGDGRAVLRSSIREFLCSEAMHALGIPTSRALCVTGSDESVVRESVETAAVVTRLAPSFLRFGSFEHWFYQGDTAALKILADYVMDRFYPEFKMTTKTPKQHYQAWLTEVVRRTAHLMALWQAAGFMHGVMNTDNMSILGLTLDYGPFGFMEAFDERHICNHTDTQGRYAYHRQPEMGRWNCYALAQALSPLIEDIDKIRAALATYETEFATKWSQLFHRKLGLQTRDDEDDFLFKAMFQMMQASRVDFTLFFRHLGNLVLNDPGQDQPVRALFEEPELFDTWAVQYRQRLKQENSHDGARQTAMQAVNPKYILRNYLAQSAIEKAQDKDFSEVNKLLSILQKPYDEQAENESYAQLPPAWSTQLEVSCSS